MKKNYNIKHVSINKAIEQNKLYNNYYFRYILN
jgi:hypothetical protein